MTDQAAQRAYQFAYGVYLDQRTRYEWQSDMVKKLEDWIIGFTHNIIQKHAASRHKT
jgi:hypothetical protein